MLIADDSGRSVCSGDYFMPFTSRKSIGRMVRNLRRKAIDSSNLSSLICVTSYAGYFLQEIVLSDTGKYTGLEEELRIQALECFATARGAVSRTLLKAPPSIENLQALTYGVHTPPHTLYILLAYWQRIDQPGTRKWRLRSCMAPHRIRK